MQDINDIMRLLPHRYPFLLIDRIVDGEEGKWAKGIKCVSAGENFFTGHFPGHKVMPGVLIVEALAQVGAVAVLSRLPKSCPKIAGSLRFSGEYGIAVSEDRLFRVTCWSLNRP